MSNNAQRANEFTFDPTGPRLFLAGERASAILQGELLLVFDSPDPSPEDQPILALHMRHRLEPIPVRQTARQDDAQSHISCRTHERVASASYG